MVEGLTFVWTLLRIMKKQISAILKYAFFFGLGLFLVWWSLRQIPANKWDEFMDTLKGAKYWLMVPVFVILSLSHIVRALRWRILMEPMGYKPSIPNTFFAVMIGYLANLAIPRLGEVLKCTLLAKYEKVPAEKLVGTIVAERAVDVLSLGIVFIITLLTQTELIASYGMQLFKQLFENKSGQFSMQKIGMVVGGIIIVIILLKIWSRKYGHLPFVMSAKKILSGIWEGVSSIRYLQQKGLFIFYSVTIWSLYIGGTWVGLSATAGTAGLGFNAALAALAFGSIGMIVTPGGIGAYAFFIAKIVEKMGVPFEIGFANGTIQWFAQFIIVLIVGSICLLLLPIYNKNKMSNESN
jgi:uncharacterized protein (TIRG00374 family)